MQVGKTIDKINDILFWSLVVLVVSSAVWDTIHLTMYGQLFDFRWNSKFVWFRTLFFGFGGVAYISYKIGAYRGAKLKKCCLQIQSEARNDKDR